MRLQVGIERQHLPTVSILYNTDASPDAITTISEFLAGIDKIVPLESADGEWGLEDYVVKAACRPGRPLFECLHYQLIGDVLRDDDEVWIRPLSTEEIRERRRGQRVQILPDGRHLYDGVAWGRRYNYNVSRPGVIIPPRKRRRLLPADDEDDNYDENNEDEFLSLKYPATESQIGRMIDDEYEDDEDDEDEEEGDDFDSEHNSEVLDEPNELPLQIYARQDFDNADSPSNSQQSDSGSETGDVQPEGLEEDELQLLLQEAKEVEDAYHSLPLEFRITPPPNKRKRIATEDDELDEEEATFEGFSSPAKQLRYSIPPAEDAEETIRGTIGDYIVSEPVNDIPETLSRPDAVDSATPKAISNHQVTHPSVNGIHNPELDSVESDDSSDSTSSEDTSDSESESVSASDESSSESDSDLNSEIDGSESDSESDSESTSSSEESDSESNSDTGADIVTKRQAKPKGPITNVSTSEPTTKLQLDNPPGTGTKRTRSNNARVKLRRRLNSLKERGLLPSEAGFEELRAYEVDHGAEEETEIEADKIDPSDSAQLDQRKQEMLARLNAVYENDTTSTTDIIEQLREQDLPQQEEIGDSQPQPQPAIVNQPSVIENIAATPSTAQSRSSSSTQKRARLDIESSRRMLFGSLGLKNPKTPEAEQALREKLAKPVRNVQTKQIEIGDSAAQPASKTKKGDWRDKLIISAVECVQEGLILSAPPFPFKQRWDRDSNKKNTQQSEQHYSQSYEENNDVQMSEASLVHPQVEIPKSLTDSRTISAGTADMDDIPYPKDIASLPALEPSDVKINAIIAYKQLHLNVKFEPEESPYRVARVVSINDDLIDVILAKRDRDQPLSTSFDEETGERIYNKFEMPVEDERVPDDGLRETTFEDMIAPKLVRATDIQVAQSGQESGSAETGTQEHQDSAVIPESASFQTSVSVEVTTSQVNVDTPRRDEISNLIKDAGFNTNVDEQLLQPIDMLETRRNSSSIINSSRASSRHSEFRERTSNVRKEPTVEWRSSSFEPDAQNDTSQPKGQDSNSTDADPSSPPTVSMVETVDYPHVSHIEINQSSVIDPAGSSSYQDAQRISPDVPDIEHTDLTHLRMKEVDMTNGDVSQASSLPSEVPASQPHGVSVQVSNGNQRQYKQNTSINPHDDEIASSGFVSGSESVDSDGLLSLRALTSSQKARTKRGSKSRYSASQPLLRVSPPPLRKTRSTINPSNIPPLDDSPDPLIKISASQKPSVTMSQIPQDASIVDLTLSSDPVEPNEEAESPPTKRKVAKSTKSRAASNKDSVGAGRITKSAVVQLGVRNGSSGKGRGRA